jgi:competence protein ComEC
VLTFAVGIIALQRQAALPRLSYAAGIVALVAMPISSTLAVIDAVQASVAAITPGYRDRFQHSRPELLERYVAAGAGICRTDHDGALTLDSGDGGSQARHEREYDAHYWRELPRRGDLPPVQ